MSVLPLTGLIAGDGSIIAAALLSDQGAVHATACCTTVQRETVYGGHQASARVWTGMRPLASLVCRVVCTDIHDTCSTIRTLFPDALVTGWY